MTRILITNAWSWFNKGDAAIVIAMAQSLRDAVPDAEISILSCTQEIDSLKYAPYRIKVLPGLRLFRSQQRWRLAKAAETLGSWFRRSVWAITYRTIKIDAKWLKGKDLLILDEFARSDIILSCAGEVIWGNTGYVAINLLEIFFGRLLGKPVIIYGHSIGPFDTKRAGFIARIFLNQAQLIMLREPVSKRYLNEIRIQRPPVVITADPAFLLDTVAPNKADALLAKAGVAQVGTRVGLTLRRWIFPGAADAVERHRIYVTEMACVVDYLTEQLNSTVVFFPQVIVPGNDFEDDRMVAREVESFVKNKDKLKILTDDYSPEELKGMIGRMDLFVGTRMHSNIFALSSYVPTVAIGYRHKTAGIMAMLDLGDYVCNISDIKASEVILKVQMAQQNAQSIIEHLCVKICHLRAAAKYSAELAATFIRK